MPKSFRERVEERGKLFLAALAVVTTLVSAVLLLSSVGIGVNDWRKKTLDWRDQEYNKLRSLHAGYTREKFESVLGEPVFDRESRSGKFREQTFRRRGHWVQTISDRAGSVQVYAVTACGEEFKPNFQLSGASGDASKSANVELNSTSLASAVGTRAAPELDYSVGVTANTRFHDVYYGGNPSNYKTFVVGLNDVCADWEETLRRFYREAGLPREAEPVYEGPLEKAPAWVKRARRVLVANTYAETAPFFKDPRPSFQFGADRILTRTTGD